MSLIFVSAAFDSPWAAQTPDLSSSSHDFQVFRSHGELSQRARLARPDGVILSCLRPGHHERELMRQLSTSWDHLPILLASELLSPDDAMRCARAGTTHVFTEPLTGRELLARLDQAIAEERQRMQEAEDQDLLDAHQVKPLRHVIEAHLCQTLDICNGNRSQAAKLLGIDRSTLRRRLAES